jgi:hypothetical protein
MRMRRLGPLACLLAACSPAAQPAAAITPTPRLAESPTAVASASPTPSPSPLADLPLATVGFSCRLPVVTDELGGATRTLQGGFLAFPRAEFAIDLNARFQQDSEGTLTGETGPVLHGQGDVFYDAGGPRWVPVAAQQSRPDGFEYAYTTIDRATNATIVHVVDVASGEARQFRINSTEVMSVADYGAAGIYLIRPSALGGAGEGVWLMNPNTGALKQLRAVHGVWAVRNGIAWAAAFDARDKTKWEMPELIPANSIVRIDLATGAKQTWFYRAGTYPWWVGFGPNGWPVIETQDTGDGHAYRLLDHSTEAGRVVYAGALKFWHVQGDGARLWLGGEHGIYLYTRDAGLKKVFAFAGSPDGVTHVIAPTGFCL